MMNALLGYPDGNGTDRYAEVPIPFVTYEITTEEGTTRNYQTSHGGSGRD